MLSEAPEAARSSAADRNLEITDRILTSPRRRTGACQTSRQHPVGQPLLEQNPPLRNM